MKMKEALEELKKLADEKDCSITCNCNSWSDDNRFHCYISDVGVAPESKTLQGALDMMKVFIAQNDKPADEVSDEIQS